MPISPAAKRLVSLIRGIPAKHKEKIGRAFDIKHNEVMRKHENEYLALAAQELSQVNFKESLNSVIDNFINESGLGAVRGINHKQPGPEDGTENVFNLKARKQNKTKHLDAIKRSIDKGMIDPDTYNWTPRLMAAHNDSEARLAGEPRFSGKTYPLINRDQFSDPKKK